MLDLPAVGTHLQEHLGVNLHPFFVNQTFSASNPLTPENINLFIKNTTGTYSVHICVVKSIYYVLQVSLQF